MSSSNSPTNVVILSLDCVRTEALGCYSESFPFSKRMPYRAHTPNIDRIAADSVTFQQAFCQAPFTPASHASVFTGRNPYNHGIRSIFGHKLREDVPTLAEKARDTGFETGAFIGAHALNTDYGLARGFDTYDEEFDESRKNWLLGQRRPCDEVTDRALAWLDDIPTDAGALAFLHFFDAHDAVSAYNEERTDSEAKNGDGPESGRLRQMYRRFGRPIDRLLGRPVARAWKSHLRLRGEFPYGVRYHLKQVTKIDKQVGRVVNALQDRNEYEDTLLIVLADHGDAFGEHGEFSHREYLYDTTLHVPLLVKPPGSSDVDTCSDVVRLTDIYPTVLTTLGVPTGDCDGKSLFEAATEATDRYAYAETRHERSADDFDDLEKSFVGLRSSRWKLIVDRLSGERELYDMQRDPDERINRYSDRPDVAERLEMNLEELLSESSEDTNTMSNNELEDVQGRLEGLGYL